MLFGKPHELLQRGTHEIPFGSQNTFQFNVPTVTAAWEIRAYMQEQEQAYQRAIGETPTFETGRDVVKHIKGRPDFQGQLDY